MENLDKISKIDFPKPLSHEGVISLLSYLVKNIPSSLVTYSISRQGTINLDQDRLIDRARSHTFAGNIGVTSKYGGTVPFECYKDESEEEDKDSITFNSLEMLTSGFNNIAQIPIPYLKVMRLIKEKTQEFFKSLNE